MVELFTAEFAENMRTDRRKVRGCKRRLSYHQLAALHRFVRPLRLIGHEIQTDSRRLDPLVHITRLPEVLSGMVQERLSTTAL
jgi:hypothetical protein